jgi:hypothetical protein
MAKIWFCDHGYDGIYKRLLSLSTSPHFIVLGKSFMLHSLLTTIKPFLTNPFPIGLHLRKIHGFCCNLTIRFVIKCGIQGTWGQESLFESEHTFHKWGKVQKIEPNDSQIFRVLVEMENKHQIGPLRYHWKGLEIQMPKVPLHYSFRLETHKL